RPNKLIIRCWYEIWGRGMLNPEYASNCVFITRSPVPIFLTSVQAKAAPQFRLAARAQPLRFQKRLDLPAMTQSSTTQLQTRRLGRFVRCPAPTGRLLLLVRTTAFR